MLKSLTHDPSSPRARKVSAKRRTILRAAKTVFLKAGFGGATMDAVAERAGVSKMTVYRHFEDKEVLFAGVITELCQQIIDDDFNTLLDRPLEEALREFARKTISILFALETVELHRIVIAECQRFPKLGRFFYESGPEASINGLAKYFAQNKTNPALKVQNARRSAEEFLELLRGYSHLRVLLGLQKVPTRREISERINAAIRHVMV